jgi:hypothetical protein
MEKVNLGQAKTRQQVLLGRKYALPEPQATPPQIIETTSDG